MFLNYSQCFCALHLISKIVWCIFIRTFKISSINNAVFDTIFVNCYKTNTDRHTFEGPDKMVIGYPELK